VRVIAGTLRGRKLLGPAPGDLSIRPTADRAREALFSILQKWPTGPFLDLFGGTGVVALEAWSRGYAPVVCIERSPGALKLMEANARGTGVRILKADLGKPGSLALPGQAVIFVDPPYEASGALWPKLAPVLASWLAPGGILVWETDAGLVLEAPPELAPVEVRAYGAARFHFFRLPER
jgi:16S rRNA (guanine966-N2)-methyltransferase